MILDKNTILCNGLPTKAENIFAVDTGFMMAGRKNILFYFNVLEDFVGGTSLEFSLHEADSEKGIYSEIENSSFTYTLAELEQGMRAPYKFLPQSTKKRWIKLVVSATGTFTAGSLLCALVREEEDGYTEGMYYDKGMLIA